LRLENHEDNSKIVVGCFSGTTKKSLAKLKEAHIV
jgi:hypothetical protein